MVVTFTMVLLGWAPNAFGAIKEQLRAAVAEALGRPAIVVSNDVMVRSPVLALGEDVNITLDVTLDILDAAQSGLVSSIVAAPYFPTAVSGILSRLTYTNVVLMSDSDWRAKGSGSSGPPVLIIVGVAVGGVALIVVVGGFLYYRARTAAARIISKRPPGGLFGGDLPEDTFGMDNPMRRPGSFSGRPVLAAPGRSDFGISGDFTNMNPLRVVADGSGSPIPGAPGVQLADGDTLAPPPSHRGPGTASDANNPFPVNDRIEMGKATIRHVGVKPATKLGLGSGEGGGSSPGSEGGDSPKGKLRMRSFGDDILARSNPLLVTAGGLEASRLEQLSKYRMAGGAPTARKGSLGARHGHASSRPSTPLIPGLPKSAPPTPVTPPPPSKEDRLATSPAARSPPAHDGGGGDGGDDPYAFASSSFGQDAV